jgi:peptide/nickel transport system permease protein
VRHIIFRVAITPILLLATSFVIFSLLTLTPGSPETALAGGRHLDAATLQALRARYHLDAPFMTQYVGWLWRALHGDFGDSISQQATVASTVGPRLVPTLQLVSLAVAIVLVLGVGAGVLAAVRRGGVDRLLSGAALVASAVPSFVVALLLISIFGVDLGWFPVIGIGGDSSTFGWDRLHHLILPSIALAIAAVALVMRTTRSGMIRALGSEFVDTMRSRGLPESTVIGRYALRHAALPVVTITGLVAGYMLAGAVIVEYAFGLNGIGALLVTAVQQKDFALVQAIGLLLVVAFLAINLVVDLLYGVIDPRVRTAADR